MILKNILTALFIAFLALNVPQLNAQIQRGASLIGQDSADRFGSSVCMPDVNTIGVAHIDGLEVFNWNGSSWSQKGNVIPNLNTSVHMPDENTIAGGDPWHDGNGSNSGIVKVYSWDGSSWSQKGGDLSGANANVRFGTSISMPNPNTIAIGGRGNFLAGGQVQVYTWNGSSWSQKGQTFSGTVDQGYGRCVNMPDANTLAISGAYYVDGKVEIYRWNGSAWVQKGITLAGQTNSDDFGHSVSMPDSNTIAIGAPDGNSDRGYVEIRKWDGTAWGVDGIIIGGQFQTGKSGSSVSMPSPNTVAIGSPNYIPVLNAPFGRVRIYTKTSTNWDRLVSDIEGVYDSRLGTSVSMPNATCVAVGGPTQDPNDMYSGYAMIYDVCSTSESAITPVACDSYTSPSGLFTYTESGTYYDTLQNAKGCDSVITIDLLVPELDTSIALNTSGVFNSNDNEASYQWINCETNTSISGANAQSYTPTENGSYAVVLTEETCSDTSSCIEINNVGISNVESHSFIKLYPNPTTDVVNLSLNTMDEVGLRVYDTMGRLHHQEAGISGNHSFELNAPAGAYDIVITRHGRHYHSRLIKR